MSVWYHWLRMEVAKHAGRPPLIKQPMGQGLCMNSIWWRVNWIKWLIWSVLKWENLEIAAWNPLKPWKTMGHWGTEGPNALRFCPPKKVHICEQNAGPIPRQRTEASQSFQEGMDTKTWLIPPNNHWNRIIIDRLLTRSSDELKVRRRTKYLAYIAYICLWYVYVIYIYMWSFPSHFPHLPAKVLQVQYRMPPASRNKHNLTRLLNEPRAAQGDGGLQRGVNHGTIQKYHGCILRFADPGLIGPFLIDPSI